MSIPAQALRRERQARHMLIDVSKACITWLRLERHGGVLNDQEAFERSRSLLDRSLRDGRRARGLLAPSLGGRWGLAWLCFNRAGSVRLCRGGGPALLEAEPSQSACPVLRHDLERVRQ